MFNLCIFINNCSPQDINPDPPLAHNLYIIYHLKIFRFKEGGILRTKYFEDKIITEFNAGTASWTGLTSPFKSPGMDFINWVF